MLHSITITLTHVDHVMGSNVNPCLGRFLCSFFLQHFHIPPYIRFWPSLVKVTGTMTSTHAKKILMGNRLVDFIFRQQRYSKIKYSLASKLPGGGEQRWISSSYWVVFHRQLHRLAPKLEKRVCFWRGHKFWEKMAENEKNMHAENTCCVFWKSFYEDDIQPEIQVPPPPWASSVVDFFYQVALDMARFVQKWTTSLHKLSF